MKWVKALHVVRVNKRHQSDVTDIVIFILLRNLEQMQHTKPVPLQSTLCAYRLGIICCSSLTKKDTYCTGHMSFCNNSSFHF